MSCASSPGDTTRAYEDVVLDDGAGSVVSRLLNRSKLQSFYKKRLLARDSLG